VLQGLSDAQLAALLPTMTEVPLLAGQILQEPGQRVEDVYFPLYGVISLLVPLGPVEVVEVATIGREGVLGMTVFLGGTAPTEHACVQVAGLALTMTAEAFAAEVHQLDGPLESRLRRYAQTLVTQLARNAACNRSHNVRQRAARWLLTTADRTDGLSFELTQQDLAQMLAVRRASVNEVAQALSHDGSITYTRGVVEILDRDRLQSHSCDCYLVLARATAAALRPSLPETSPVNR